MQVWKVSEGFSLHSPTLGEDLPAFFGETGFITAAHGFGHVLWSSIDVSSIRYLTRQQTLQFFLHQRQGANALPSRHFLLRASKPRNLLSLRRPNYLCTRNSAVVLLRGFGGLASALLSSLDLLISKLFWLTGALDIKIRRQLTNRLIARQNIASHAGIEDIGKDENYDSQRKKAQSQSHERFH
jgi:hypothetical protein